MELLIGLMMGASGGVAFTVLSLMWQDRRPQHRADALEDAAIRRYVHHANVWA